MRTAVKGMVLGAVVGGAIALADAGALVAQQPDGYARASSGTRLLSLPGGTTIRLLLEAANLGGTEIEVAEITFPVGADPSRGHRHGSIEIFYVVEGTLGHVVNGREFRLEPGMLGVVRPDDSVAHRVLSEVPVKALVLWVPGGEADRIAPPERWSPVGPGH